MKFNLFNFFANLIFPPLSEEDKIMVEKIKEKQNKLNKYGGRMKVIGRGTLIHEFDTEEGKIAYWKMIRKKKYNKVKKVGYKSVRDFVEKK